MRYGKLLLVNRPLQNREKWPEFELFANGETQPRRPGSCLWRTKRGAARFRLSVCLFRAALWLTAWQVVEFRSEGPTTAPAGVHPRRQ